MPFTQLTRKNHPFIWMEECERSFQELNEKLTSSPYQILYRVGPVAYQLALPPVLSNLHNVFHVSQLRKYIQDLSHVVEMDDVQVRENLTYEKGPVPTIDHKLKELRGKSIKLVKILWVATTGEAT
uniref:Tf2-1-like SH3-like domain-containing protein n=1 Tax=Cajanus cajan TaxID=3821 RepID=A0A151RX97_CAJCA|nr:hypothetical protein KK1_031202 [Cajanus cajan]